MPCELHIHVEEPSMEAFLNEFLPRVLGDAVAFRVINHQSKTDLLTNLPTRLIGYAKRRVEDRPNTLVLVDRDSDDCAQLKQRLEQACEKAKLSSKSLPAPDGSFAVVNRIVVEELEAWYFGAVPELAIAFPGVPLSLGKKQKYRDTDAIRGGTHEQLLRVLQKAGHYKGQSRLPKIEIARKMGSLVDAASNRSISFNHFLSGLQALAK